MRFANLMNAASTQFMATISAMYAKNFAAVKQYITNARKGQFGGVSALTPLALSIVMVAIVVGIGAIILGEMQNATDNADAVSVLSKGISALTDFSNFFTIIVVVGVAAVIFLLLRVVRRTGQTAEA